MPIIRHDPQYSKQYFLRTKTGAQELAQIRLAERGARRLGRIYGAAELMRMAIDRHGDRIAVSWSGGRCSTVVLHMALQLKKDIKVLHNDTGVEYPETERFVRDMSRRWDLNLHVVKPVKTFWEIVDKHGFPKPRKPMNPRTGDRSIRTPACCIWLKERPVVRFAREEGVEAFITGMRAAEARIRALSTWRKGQFYFHKNQKVWKYNPIILWSTYEVASYVEEHKVPLSPLYEKVDRTGCWPCTAFIGWQEQLARTNPRFYKFMMERMDEQRLAEHFYDSRIAPCSDRG